MLNDRPSSSPGLIHPLPPRTISTLRSSSLITSVAQAVTELVQNALDAHARQVVVYLDLERWALRVEDDGTGMRRETVEAIGSGLRYGQSSMSRRSRSEPGREGGPLGELDRSCPCFHRACTTLEQTQGRQRQLSTHLLLFSQRLASEEKVSQLSCIPNEPPSTEAGFSAHRPPSCFYPISACVSVFNRITGDRFLH